MRYRDAGYDVAPRGAAALLVMLALCAVSAQAQVVVVRGHGGGGAVAAPDWTSTTLSLHELDNSHSSQGTCGTTCDTLFNGNAVFSTTQVWQGTHSVTFDGVGDRVSCPGGACTPIAERVGTRSFTAAVWPATGLGNTSRAVDWVDATGGMHASYNSGNLECLLRDGTDAVAVAAASTLALDVWTHVACVHDATADDLEVFVAGVSDGGPVTQQDLAASGVSLGIGARGSSATANEWAGFIDEVAFWDIALGPQSICRVCSCGVDGSLCTISGTSWVDEGRNVGSCGNCTLPTDASQSSAGVN